MYLSPREHLAHKTRLYWRMSLCMRNRSKETFRVGQSLTIIRNTKMDYPPSKAIIQRFQELENQIVYQDDNVVRFG